MFPSILIIFKELLNISKAYVKHRCIIKYIKICAQVLMYLIINLFSYVDIINVQ